MPAGGEVLLGKNGDYKEKYFEIFAIVILLAFGIYQSVLYFGHQMVPNSDFPAFVKTAHQLLSFEIPSSFKRVPVLGILQIGLSKFVSGDHPELTAGWLLNAILHPLSIVLLYLVGRKFLGYRAVWFALIAGVNPWMLNLLRQPIAETTLIFFTLLTFYFILRRSNWCYLFAAITSMVRYEGAVLILIALVMDISESISTNNGPINWPKVKRRWISAFLHAALASVPLGLWLLGTWLTWKQGTSHYVGHYGRNTIICKFATYLWDVSIMPLFQPTNAEAAKIITCLSKIIVAMSLLTAAGYGIFKRRWDILTLLLFLVPYFFIHSFRSGTQPRYAMPAAWLTLLLCACGLWCLWQLINQWVTIPRAVAILLQVILLLGSGVWLITLIPHLPKLTYYSPTSASIPYVVVGLAIVVFLVRTVMYRGRFALRDTAATMLVCLTVISNQFMLVRTVGRGQADREFRDLARWYLENAQPDEKMVTTMAHVVSIFAPRYKNSFVHTGSIKGKDTNKFLESCYKKDITYVTWDSRIGFSPQKSYYKQWRIRRIAPLQKPRSIGPFKFISQIKVDEKRFVNIFRLLPPDSINKVKPAK
ncbi:MAG: hypothetical protein KAJ46_06555 [Sedimentisphaerales bacterium]|nr:hypothetical protein [Sedimentisphaerales bacterium]